MGHDESVKLNVDQVIELCAKIDGQGRSRLLESLAQSGVDEEVRIRELKLWDMGSGDPQRLFDYVMTLPGALDVLRLAGSSTEYAIDDPQMYIHAATLVGISPSRFRKSGTDDTDPT